MNRREDAPGRMDVLDLTEYEEEALYGLMELGRTTAPDLSEATGIPKARIYGVLDELADVGYIKVIPGRPKEYQPKPPAEVLDRAVENRRQSYETYEQTVDEQRDAFVDALQPLYASGTEEVSPTEELFHVVDVGEPSERETRALFRDADDQIRILTKSFEYLPSVEVAVADALDRGVRVRALFLDPKLLEADNRPIQADIYSRVRDEYPTMDVRFANSRLPWRGTIADPSMDYDSGNAIILVEEEDIPLYKRQAAVTDNASFVAGLGRYFELTWEHETLDSEPYTE